MTTNKYSSYTYEFKYIIIGDTNVGKTCLLLQFTTKKFNSNSEITVGVDFGTSTIEIGSNQRIKLHIWDTSGQDAFRSITRSYYRSAIIALLVYDITNGQTLQHLKYWLQSLRDDASNDLIMMLVGNKSDLEHKREISEGKGMRFAQSNHMFGFLECSAKTGINVDKVFVKPAKHLFNAIGRGLVKIEDNTHSIKLGPNAQFQAMYGGTDVQSNVAFSGNKKNRRCACVII